jgi:2-dehydro-3-deoxyphosphooctonate aldolase (KDO 8-P synthase)
VKKITIDNISIGAGEPFVLFAGPCVIEDGPLTLKAAEDIKAIAQSLNLGFIFKCSYDKANRTSADAFRGPGLAEGLEILKTVKETLSIPILTDVHSVLEVDRVAEVADVIQIPALLCRQTDLLIAAAKTGKVVNIKKGQFMAPHDMGRAAQKITDQGNKKVLLTERGTTFGYNNLVVDFRSIPVMRSTGFPVIFDATHSVQLPGGLGEASGGDRSMISHLARAAIAVGVDGLFLEVHPDPDHARCDGPNSLVLDDLEPLLKDLIEIDKLSLSIKGDS